MKGFEEMDHLRGSGMEDAMEIQRRFNELHNLLVEYVRHSSDWVIVTDDPLDANVVLEDILDADLIE